jgi:small GTP-binding protein
MEFYKKVAIIGEGGVGKTTLLHRYMNGKFNNHMDMTVGVEFFTKRFAMNHIVGSLLIWDLGGQDQFKSLMPGYLEGSEGIILVYDLSRLITLLKLHKWIEILKKINVPLDGSIPILLVGCKKDLLESCDEINDQRKEYIDEIYSECAIMKYIETSALKNENVSLPFDTLIDYYLSKQTQFQNEECAEQL